MHQWMQKEAILQNKVDYMKDFLYQLCPDMVPQPETSRLPGQGRSAGAPLLGEAFSSFSIFLIRADRRMS